MTTRKLQRGDAVPTLAETLLGVILPLSLEKNLLGAVNCDLKSRNPADDRFGNPVKNVRVSAFEMRKIH